MCILSIIICIRLFRHYGNTTYVDRVCLRGSRVTRTVHLFRIITRAVRRLYYYPCTECLQNTSKWKFVGPRLKVSELVLSHRRRRCTTRPRSVRRGVSLDSSLLPAYRFSYTRRKRLEFEFRYLPEKVL